MRDKKEKENKVGYLTLGADIVSGQKTVQSHGLKTVIINGGVSPSFRGHMY